MGQFHPGGCPNLPYVTPNRGGVVHFSKSDIADLTEQLAPALVAALNGARPTAAASSVNPLSIDSKKRPSPAKDKVRNYLRENPSALNFSVRKLSALIGVNHETISQVLREMPSN